MDDFETSVVSSCDPPPFFQSAEHDLDAIASLILAQYTNHQRVVAQCYL